MRGNERNVQGTANGAVAGLLGGVVTLLVLLVLAATAGRDLGPVLRMPFVDDLPWRQGLSGRLAGVLCHLGLSAAWGAALGRVWRRWSSAAVMAAAPPLGLAIWALMFLVVLPMNPWMPPQLAVTHLPRNLACHVLFGLTVGAAYLGLRDHPPRRLRHGLPLGAARMAPPARDRVA
jgi:hypothetical protein